MWLHSVKVAGLRSIERAELESCGRFNVLIGKNNSGKSNVLSAIRGFFETMKGSEVVNLRPMFTLDDDFYDRNTRKPIDITCTFAVTSKDATQIIDDIAKEFPQISNAVSHLRHSQFLRITVKYFLRPGAFALVCKIAMSEASDAIQQDNFTTLFEISDDVSPQIYDLFRKSAQKQDEADAYNLVVKYFDTEDFARHKAAAATSWSVTVTHVYRTQL